MTYKNFSLEECDRALQQRMRDGRFTFYQKWTCARCGDRVTGNTPNKLFTHGHHEECGHITDIRQAGCNYMMVSVVRG